MAGKETWKHQNIPLPSSVQGLNASGMVLPSGESNFFDFAAQHGRDISNLEDGVPQPIASDGFPSAQVKGLNWMPGSHATEAELEAYFEQSGVYHSSKSNLTDPVSPTGDLNIKDSNLASDGLQSPYTDEGTGGKYGILEWDSFNSYIHYKYNPFHTNADGSTGGLPEDGPDITTHRPKDAAFAVKYPQQEDFLLGEKVGEYNPKDRNGCAMEAADGTLCSGYLFPDPNSHGTMKDMAKKYFYPTQEQDVSKINLDKEEDHAIRTCNENFWAGNMGPPNLESSVNKHKSCIADVKQKYFQYRIGLAAGLIPPSAVQRLHFRMNVHPGMMFWVSGQTPHNVNGFTDQYRGGGPPGNLPRARCKDGFSVAEEVGDMGHGYANKQYNQALGSQPANWVDGKVTRVSYSPSIFGATACVNCVPVEEIHVMKAVPKAGVRCDNVRFRGLGATGPGTGVVYPPRDKNPTWHDKTDPLLMVLGEVRTLKFYTNELFVGLNGRGRYADFKGLDERRHLPNGERNPDYGKEIWEDAEYCQAGNEITQKCEFEAVAGINIPNNDFNVAGCDDIYGEKPYSKWDSEPIKTQYDDDENIIEACGTRLSDAMASAGYFQVIGSGEHRLTGGVGRFDGEYTITVKAIRERGVEGDDPCGYNMGDFRMNFLDKCMKKQAYTIVPLIENKALLGVPAAPKIVSITTDYISQKSTESFTFPRAEIPDKYNGEPMEGSKPNNGGWDYSVDRYWNYIQNVRTLANGKQNKNFGGPLFADCKHGQDEDYDACFDKYPVLNTICPTITLSEPVKKGEKATVWVWVRPRYANKDNETVGWGDATLTYCTAFASTEDFSKITIKAPETHFHDDIFIPNASNGGLHTSLAGRLYTNEEMEENDSLPKYSLRVGQSWRYKLQVVVTNEEGLVGCFSDPIHFHIKDSPQTRGGEE